MSLQDWGITLVAGVSILIPVEIAKLVMSRRTHASAKVV